MITPPSHRPLSGPPSAFQQVAGLGALALLLFTAACTTPTDEKPQAALSPPVNVMGVVSEDFVFPAGRFKSCHAPTLVETREGVLAAWFAGPREGDTKVSIWTARWQQGRWSTPVEVARGDFVQGVRWPCWNPVLFHNGAGNSILLVYKVGPNPSTWRTMIMTSTDEGKTWSKRIALPDDRVATVKNKPVLLSDGSILAGSSIERDLDWQVHVERSADQGRTWQRSNSLNDGTHPMLLQPAILQWSDQRIQLLCRSAGNGGGKIYTSWMQGTWDTWSTPLPLDVPNPNSGIDAVMLADKRGLLVYNDSPAYRSPLAVALSLDGKDWHRALTLEDEPKEEFSYPAVIQTQDQLVHVLYTWKRKTIKHVTIDPRLLASPGATSSNNLR